MPTPQTSESESNFVSRCIPIVIADGAAEDGSQGAAICHSMYKQWKKKGDAMPEEKLPRANPSVASASLDELEAPLRDIKDLPQDLKPRSLDEPRPGDFDYGVKQP